MQTKPTAVPMCTRVVVLMRRLRGKVQKHIAVVARNQRH